MQKIILVGGLIVAALIYSSGCARKEQPKEMMEVKPKTKFTKVDEWTSFIILQYENHKYLARNDYRAGGIVHLESCQCKTNVIKLR